MTTLWDTTGTEVVQALAAERRTGGAVMSGLALTQVIVVDEKDVAEAEAAATTAASRHPCRSLVVIRRQIDLPVPRLDAEVLIGGRLGPGEAVVMRMYGRLALHAESVVLPLLAPDAPVVTWWHGEPPDLIAHDPLGVFADRRVTDSSRAADPIDRLRQRARDYASGDTDLSWTRTTPWRALLASTFDTIKARPVRATVRGRDADPATVLLAGWLAARLRLAVPVEPDEAARRWVTVGGVGVSAITIDLDDGGTLRAERVDASKVLLHRDGQPDSTTSIPERGLGDLLAEELRRLDADQPYADALSAATGETGLNERSSRRVHIWRDPAEAKAGGAGRGEVTDSAPFEGRGGDGAASVDASRAAAAATAAPAGLQPLAADPGDVPAGPDAGGGAG